MPITAAELRTEVDSLDQVRRTALLAIRARDLAGTADLARLLDELRIDEPGWALFMAVVAGHRPVIEAALTGDSAVLAIRAVRAWIAGRPGADEVWAVLADAPAELRSRVYVALRGGHADLAGAVIDRVRARFGDREAATVLVACPPELVGRLLPELGHAVPSWHGLGSRHPDAVLAEARRCLAPLPVPARHGWWQRHVAGVLAAGRTRPDAVLDLLEAYAPPGYLPGDLGAYGPLVRADARRVARLAATPDRAGWLAVVRLPRPVLRGFAGLDLDDLVPLARQLRDSERAFVALMKAVAPGRRAELYDAAYAGVDTAHTERVAFVLDQLPHGRRVAEARRILGLAAVRQDEQRVLRYTAYLPWAEAADTLTAATRAITAEERGTAYELLVQCAARSRDTAAMNDAVSRAVRVRNEQDPVRIQVFSQLARVSPRLLDARAITDLDRLVTDALEARDVSFGTRQAVSILVVNVLREHATDPELVAWSTGAMGRIFGGGRLPWLGDLSRCLRRGQEHDFFEAVRGWVTDAVRRGDHEPLFTVARALGKRGWDVEPLQDMIGNAIKRGNTVHVLRNAIELWLAPPATRTDRVAEVVAFDSSALAITAVWAVVSGYRTDLLDKALGDRPPKGKFLNAGPRWVPPEPVRPDRWLDRQRRRYVELLDKIAADKGTALNRRAWAIKAAARIPGRGWDATARWIDAPDVVLAEAALGALVLTDRPADALVPLLAHAGDDRARVGSYAAARAARFVPPSRLGPILTGQAMAEGKVTTRKQLVRLVATLCGPDAGTALLAEWRRDGQHRDVRAAIVAAARQRTDLPEAWEVLSDAAGRADALALLAADPLDLAEPHRPRYAALVVTCATSDDEPTARAAWGAMPAWLPWAPDLTGPIADRLTAVHDRLVWRATADALTTLAAAGGGSAALRAALARLIDLDRDDPGTDPEHDRAAWRRIEDLTGYLIRWSRGAPWDADRAVLSAAAGALAGYDACAWQAATLRLETVSLVDPGVAGVLAALGARFRSRPALTAALRAQLADLVDRDQRWTPGDLITSAGTLAASGDGASGQFAVALAVGGARYGWSQPWRELVAALRRHGDPDVRDAAMRLRMGSPH